jgi:hypothetical protein
MKRGMCFGGGSPRRVLLVVPFALLLSAVLAASASACLKITPVSRWEGRWHDVHGYSGTWSAEVTATETSPGVWHAEGNGEVVVPFYGAAPGHVTETLECTSPTTDLTLAHWTDSFGDNTNLTGTLSIAKEVALENGTWSGNTFSLGFDEGGWEGEFHPQSESEGLVPGKVEVQSSAGTLINSFKTDAATELPLLPTGEDVAPIGGVSFAASLPAGETIRIKLTLPAGSHPTALLKLSEGKYVAIGATISGETIEYEITDGGPLDEDHVANGEIIDPVVPVSTGLQVRSGTLPGATRGTPYSASLKATGGAGTYRWKKGAKGEKLPKGLKLTKEGVIEGTPSSKAAPGTYEIPVTVSDSEKPRKSATSTLTIAIG